jgi:hypothetical protein
MRLETALFFDLANHALYELASERTAFEENLSSEEQEGFRQSLFLLLDAGTKELHEIPDASISGLLDEFKTGTEDFKATPCLPDPKDVGPLRNLKRLSPTAIVQTLKDGSPIFVVESTHTVPVIFVPDYGRVNRMVNIILATVKNGEDESLEETIGVKLIRLRAISDSTPYRPSELSAFRGFLGEADGESPRPQSKRKSLKRKSVDSSSLDSLRRNIDMNGNKATLSDSDPTVQQRGKSRRKCCAGFCESSESPGYKGGFTNVPAMPPVLISPTVLATMNRATQLKRRNIWLDRLEVAKERRDRKRLCVCHEHAFADEEFEVEYKATDGEKESDIVSKLQFVLSTDLLKLRLVSTVLANLLKLFL